MSACRGKVRGALRDVAVSCLQSGDDALAMLFQSGDDAGLEGNGFEELGRSGTDGLLCCEHLRRLMYGRCVHWCNAVDGHPFGRWRSLRVGEVGVGDHFGGGGVEVGVGECLSRLRVQSSLWMQSVSGQEVEGGSLCCVEGHKGLAKLSPLARCCPELIAIAQQELAHAEGYAGCNVFGRPYVAVGLHHDIAPPGGAM